MKIKFLLAAVFLITLFLFSANFASAQTADNSALIAQLQAQITQLTAQLQTMLSQQSTTTTTTTNSAAPIPAMTEGWCYGFNIYLKIGDVNTDVSALQSILGKEGLTIGDYSVANDGTFTKGMISAVVQFQRKYGIAQTGTVGPLTRAKLNALYGCVPTPTPTPTTACAPNWVCDWGDCINGYQRQIAVDRNKCPELGMPRTVCNTVVRSCTSTTSAAASITVTSPNGGEQWLQGTTHNITWQFSGLIRTDVVTITLTSVTGLPSISGPQHSYLIATNVPIASNSYTWTVPASITAADGDYKITVQDQSRLTPQKDESDNYFSITKPGCPTISCLVDSCPNNHLPDTNGCTSCSSPCKPKITANLPAGGEVWKMGETHTITWSSIGLKSTDYVDIKLSNSHNDYSYIGNSIPALFGTFSWKIDSSSWFDAASDYKIDIILASRLPKVNYSNYGKFTILSSTAVICTNFTYTDWSTCSSSGTKTRSVLVSSPIGCTNGNPITSQSCTNTTPVTPTPPVTPSETHSINVTYPNGGETLQLGRTYRITWTSQGVGYVTINILYSASSVPTVDLNNPNNNSTNTFVNTATLKNFVTPGYAVAIPASQGYYDWTPTTAQLGSSVNMKFTKYKISISDTSTAYPNPAHDASDNYFTVVPSTITGCVDGDTGQNFKVRGTTTDAYGSSLDYCINSGSLREYYCLGGSLNGSAVYTDQTCLNNSCQNGACAEDSLVVTSPAGGEQWKIGETHNITWRSTGLNRSDLVDIRLMRAGSVASTIATNIPIGTGTYSWIINQTNNFQPGDEFKISFVSKISENNIYKRIGQSANNFSITTSTTQTSVEQNNFIVSLDSSTPARSTFNTLNQKNIVYSRIRLSNNFSTAKTINSLTLVMRTDSTDTNISVNRAVTPGFMQYYLNHVKVFDGAVQIGATVREISGSTFSNNFTKSDIILAHRSLITNSYSSLPDGTYYYATIVVNLSIPAASSKTLSISADAGQFPPTGSVKFQLGFSNIGGVVANGLPVYGSMMTVAPIPSAISVSLGDHKPSESIIDGNVSAVLGSFKFTSKNPMSPSSIYKFKVKKLGTMSGDAIKVAYLKVSYSNGLNNGTQGIMTGNIVDANGYITFQPTSQSSAGIIYLQPFVTAEIRVMGTLNGEVGKTIGVSIESASDVETNAEIQQSTFPIMGNLLKHELSY